MSSVGPAKKTSPPPGPAQAKGGAFPSPLTILTLVLVLVWIATFFIPAGEYRLDPTGSPIAGSFHAIEPPLDFAGRVRDLFLAPINGLYGIKDPATGQVGPFNSGAMFGSVQVFLFILAIGAFMTTVFATGALDLGIHHLAYRFRAQGTPLIVALSVLFGILGSVMAWSNESLGLYALMVPLMIALGYDRMVAVAVVSVAPFAGAIGSTINPFVVGIGASKAGITLGDGIGLRTLLFVLVMAATIAYTVWYARRVKSDPDASISGITPEDRAIAQADAAAPAPLTGRDRAIIAIVAFTFALLGSRSSPGARSSATARSTRRRTSRSARRSPGSSAGGCRSSPRCSSSCRSSSASSADSARRGPRRRSSRASWTSPAPRSSSRSHAACR